MSSEPTLQEALRSIYDLPPDVPAVVRAVLIAIRLDNTATEEDIVNWTGWSESSVERARRFSSEHGLIATTYFYRVNGDRAASLEVPNSPNAPRGKFDGTETNLNYVRIRQLKEASSVTGTLLNSSKGGGVASQGGPLVESSRGYGREGLGARVFPKPPFTRNGSAAILVLTKRAINDLCLTAQLHQGVKNPQDVVLSRDDDRLLRRFLNTMPARDSWAPWERTVNLYSFWVQNHPRKRLKFEIKAFAAQSDQWTPSLVLWEDKSTDQMRTLPVPEAEVESDEEPTDARIGEIGALTYGITGVLPAVVHVKKLLVSYDAEEIKGALKEYAAHLGDEELKWGMKSFFAGGGAVAVITARRKREKK
jgi:hypothetical protein